LEVPRATDQKDDVVNSEEAVEFVDALSEPDEELRTSSEDDAEPDPSKKLEARRSSLKSFTTASSRPTEEPQLKEPEEASSSKVPTSRGQGGRGALGKRPVSTAESSNGALSQAIVEVPSVDADSTTSLLHKTDVNKGRSAPVTKTASKSMRERVKRTSQQTAEDGSVTRTRSNLRNLVKFDIPEDSKRAELHLRAKSAQMTIRHASTKLRRQKLKDGLVVKMERMLVRVDKAGTNVPDDFDENGDQKIDSRVKDKWREYMVVCRQSISDDADFVLQMYKTRVSMQLNMNKADLTPH
jgi:hypothetical protein